MNHLDLFSGIGGFALAAQWAGIETVAFCETDPFCRQVLKKHWPGVLKYMDVRDIANPDHVDIMTAGFPCQPFSVAGKKKGVKDDRYLWPEVIRLIRKSKPTWFIGENVPGIIPLLDPILKDLEDEGYDWRSFLIPASALGAPHKRERIWIVAHSMRKRCDAGISYAERRHIQDNWHGYAKTLQKEWTKFQPQSWAAFNFQDWLGLVADTTGTKCSERTAHCDAEPKRPERSEFTTETRDVIGNSDSITGEQANTGTITESESWTTRARHPRQSGEIDTTFGWKKDQPPIPGVDDGVPNGVDRNKSLGNAIVPQIAYIFMQMIMDIEKVKG